MSDNQNRNNGLPEPQLPASRGSTGAFKINIDETELSAGLRDRPEHEAQLREQPYEGYTESYYSTENSKEEKKAHRKRNRLKAKKNKRVFALVWICMVLLIAFTLSSYLIGGAKDFFAVSRHEGTVEIELPEKLDEDKLADILYKGGAIKKPEFFKIYSKIRIDEWEYFEPGVYQISANLDYEDILNQLQGGNEVYEEVRVTFPEGSNALEIAALLEENEVCTQEDFLKALNDVDFSNYDAISSIGSTSGKYYAVEGYLFPDTYDFYKGEKIETVIGKMIYNFQNKMTDSLMEQVETSGYSLDEIIILASIIQGEAANDTDMYNVSAVLHNRLKHGAENDIFFLECDSTIYYPYKNGKAMPNSDPMPYGNYNTYRVEGLPAGAICNPGLDAIQAALRPNTEGEAADYLYFCHSDDGTAYYATTSWEHEENLVLAGLREG